MLQTLTLTTSVCSVKTSDMPSNESFNVALASLDAKELPVLGVKVGERVVEPGLHISKAGKRSPQRTLDLELYHPAAHMLNTSMSNRGTRYSRAVLFATESTGKVHDHLPGSRRAAPVCGLSGTGPALAAVWPGAGC